MAERERNRFASYKNMGKTREEMRKKRTEVSVELRKQGRDEQLFKKRNIGTESPTEPIPDLGPIDSKNFTEILPWLTSAESSEWLMGVRRIRQALTNTKNPPIKEIIEAGLVPKLVNFLSSKYAYVNDPDSEPNACSLHYEAAWALTNIAAGSPEETQQVVRAGAIPYFIALLQSNDLSVCEQVVWALGNIAGDGPALRDEVIRRRAVDPLIALVVPGRSDAFIRNVAWTLSNLCRNKNPPPDFGQIRRCLPVIANFLDHHDSEVVSDACWALSYVTDGPNDKIQAVLDQGVVPKMVNILGRDDSALLPPCLRTLGNIVTGTDHQTQSVIDSGGLTKLEPLLKHSRVNIQKEAAWMASNIAAGTQYQIQGLLNLNLVSALLQILKKSEFKAQKEAAWAITNIVTGGSLDQVAAVANQGALEALCGVLNCRDTQIQLVLLDGINKILTAGVKIGQLNEACLQIENCGGLERIERLQGSPNEEVYRAALEIIESFWNESDNDENVEPGTNSNGGFAFKTPDKPKVKYEF